MSVPKLPPIAARDLARKLYPEDPDLMVSLLSKPYFVIDIPCADIFPSPILR